MDTSILADRNTLRDGIKPRAIPGFTITRDVLNAMSPIHRLVAKELIRKGRWHLAENRDAGADTRTCRDNMRRSPNVTRYIDE